MNTIKRVAVYDMDGTIVCSLHRYRTDESGKRIDLEYWRANQHKAYDDGLLPLHKQYLADLADPNCYVIIATARVMGDADHAFIRDKLGKPNYIISRKDGDNQSGAALKIKGLARFFNLKNFRTAEAHFYEDNLAYLSAVCKHFRIFGHYIPSKQGH